MKRLFFSLLCMLLFEAVQAQIPQMSGKVIKVIDGDTFDILQNSQSIRCRLVEVDAPERNQPFGKQAADSLKILLLNQTVVCQPIAHDVYRRWLVRVMEVNQTPISLDSLLVCRGWAWSVKGWNKQGYNLDNDPMQSQAHWYSRGLWKCPSPVPPWLWRRFNAKTKLKYPCP